MSKRPEKTINKNTAKTAKRLLKYVKVHTTSDPNSGTHPSTLRQFDLAKILVEELKELGLTDAHVDEHCYVYATLPLSLIHI